MNTVMLQIKAFIWRFLFNKKPPKRKPIFSIAEELKHMVGSLNPDDLGLIYAPGIGDKTITPLWDTIPKYTYGLTKLNTALAGNKLPKLPYPLASVAVNKMCYYQDYYIPFRELAFPFFSAVIDFCDGYAALLNEQVPVSDSRYQYHVAKLAISDRIANDLLVVIKPIYTAKKQQTV